MTGTSGKDDRMHKISVNGSADMGKLRRLLLASVIVPSLGFSLVACGSKAANDTFDLTASATDVTTSASARNRQLLVADPCASPGQRSVICRNRSGATA